MKHLFKSLVAGLLSSIGETRVGSYMYEYILNSAMHSTQNACHKQVFLKFCTPNQLNRFRIKSFSTKEPETLEWIDGFPRSSVMWDIGANVGLYSCYSY